MLKKLKNFARHSTNSQILINSFGNYLNIFFTAFFAFLLVRIMSPSDYGVLSVLLGIAYVLANILDLGTTASIYSYLPILLEEKKDQAYIFLKTIFSFQTFFSLIIIFILSVFFPFLDKNFFKTNASVVEFYLTTLSVLFFIWQNYIINSLNANKKFFESNFILNLSNVIKTIFIIILIKINSVSVATIIFTLGILGPTAFFLILFFKKFQTIKNVFKAKIDKKQFYFNYTISFFIASQFFNLALRMDLFLLSFYFPQSAQVGYYGLAQKIILTVMASIISVTQVLSPNFSKMKTKEEVKKQLKTGFLYLLAPVFLFILLYYTPEWIFTLFFTKEYDQAIVITKQLSLAFIPYVFLNLPILFLLYTVKKTLPILIENIVFFITLTLGCYFFIPNYGVLAPPIIIFFSFILALIITTIFSIKEYQKIS